jgi:hypothetical protein
VHHLEHVESVAGLGIADRFLEHAETGEEKHPHGDHRVEGADGQIEDDPGVEPPGVHHDALALAGLFEDLRPSGRQDVEGGF